MADDDVDDSISPAKVVRAWLARLTKELDAGTLVPVGYSVTDEATLRVGFEFAAPDPPPPPAPTTPAPPPPATRDACPKCGTKERPQDCGRSPGSDPPLVDLMCVRCQHVWQVPED